MKKKNNNNTRKPSVRGVQNRVGPAKKYDSCTTRETSRTINWRWRQGGPRVSKTTRLSRLISPRCYCYAHTRRVSPPPPRHWRRVSVSHSYFHKPRTQRPVSFFSSSNLIFPPVSPSSARGPSSSNVKRNLFATV